MKCALRWKDWQNSLKKVRHDFIFIPKHENAHFSQEYDSFDFCEGWLTQVAYTTEIYCFSNIFFLSFFPSINQNPPPPPLFPSFSFYTPPPLSTSLYLPYSSPTSSHSYLSFCIYSISFLRLPFSCAFPISMQCRT